MEGGGGHELSRKTTGSGDAMHDRTHARTDDGLQDSTWHP